MQLGNKWSEIARNLQGRTENQIKNRFKSMVKKASRVCPEDMDVVTFLIKEKNGEELAIPKAEKVKIKSPIVSNRFNPARSSVNEVGFSTIADRIKLKGTQCTSKQEATPSPSTMLFFHPS